MFAEEIRRQAMSAPRAALPDVTAALWKAFAAGAMTEAEAEELSGLIEARMALPVTPTASEGPKVLKAAASRHVGSRPRTDASLERRRRWAASGRLPPTLAARFSLAEQAVLALVAAESVRRKDCRLAVGSLAAIAGVSETTVRNAIREAVRLGLITVEERRITGWRNDTNVVRIVSAEWTAWLRLTRKRKEAVPAPRDERGGCKSAKGTHTGIPILWIQRPKQPMKKLPKSSGRPPTQRTIRNQRGR
ncbi:helix-turn-helix domain-containing protein [Methylorubrum zatmanii]